MIIFVKTIKKKVMKKEFKIPNELLKLHNINLEDFKKINIDSFFRYSVFCNTGLLIKDLSMQDCDNWNAEDVVSYFILNPAIKRIFDEEKV